MKIRFLSLVLVLSSIFVLVGCGASEEDRLISATAESACLAKSIIDEINPTELMEKAAGMSAEDLETFQADMQVKQADIEAQVQAILTKYGFENRDAFNAVGEQYAQDEATRKAVGDKAMELCGLTEEDLKNMGE
ncbi:hypothetical protein A2335_03130 [Candidatus Peregrinibacteria bacterium RIFOXYB2_FULL_32_7]|nr:MAG: hypothetical protein A2335_03130 [Candidatus Peregrinibacteria bacterium RIFOXYB2_FULL_32_7]